MPNPTGIGLAKAREAKAAKRKRREFYERWGCVPGKVTPKVLAAETSSNERQVPRNKGKKMRAAARPASDPRQLVFPFLGIYSCRADRDRAVAEVYLAGATLEAAAAACGVSASTVYGTLVRLGVPRRRRATQRGRVFTPEHRAKLSAGATPEVRAGRSARLRKKWEDPTYRAKVRAALAAVIRRPDRGEVLSP